MTPAARDMVLARLLERWRRSLDETAAAVGSGDESRMRVLATEQRELQAQVSTLSEGLPARLPELPGPVGAAVAAVARALERNAALIRERTACIQPELQQARRVTGQIRGVRSAYAAPVAPASPGAGWSATS